MNLTKKLREQFKHYEVSQSLKSMSPIVIETTLITFEFEEKGARTNQKIVALGESASDFNKAKEASLKSALDLLGVL